MTAKFGRVRTVSLVILSLGVLVLVGGTAFAGGRAPQSRASSGVSKAEVKKLAKHYGKVYAKSYVDSYISSHKSQLQGSQPQAFGSSFDSGNSNGPQPVTQVGPWSVTAVCQSNGVTVQFTGPGEVLGTNTLAPTNGGAGSTFETEGASGGSSFGVGNSVQGSQTVNLLGDDSDYAVTYFENADASNPTNCVVVGYAQKVHLSS